MAGEGGTVDSVTVVGGGDVGLLTALALEKSLGETSIVVVDDPDASVTEVGKSTLASVPRFLHDLLEIQPARLVANVQLSWKTTVYFEDWCGVEPFHSPLGDPLPIVMNARGDARSTMALTPDHTDAFHEYYHRYRHRDFSTVYGEVAERPGTAPIAFEEGDQPLSMGRMAIPSFGYQFDSRSFNEFLRAVCVERGVELRDDRVTDVVTDDDRIESLESDRGGYESDLFVDASGFERVLMGALENPFVEFDLPVDSAVATTVDIPLSDVVSATVVTTTDEGWIWQIDTWGEGSGARDLGYVYSADHVADEDAERTFLETRDEPIDPDDLRRYRFDSGVVETPWLGNCVAVGNALGFVEPLQSTALSTACLLAANLARGLAKHGRINHRGLRRLYNETTRSTWEEVYDFVSVYYKYASGSSPFWRDARGINPGTSPQYEAYQDLGFSGWRELNHLTRTGTDLNGIDLYFLSFRNLGVESRFYEELDVAVDRAVAERVEAYTAGLSDEVEGFATYEELDAAIPADWIE